MQEILNFFDELFPNPKCELEYKKDYEFLISVVLSAQTTDKMVNLVTKDLFDKYDTLEKLNLANIDDIKNIIRPIGTFNKKAQFIKDISKVLLEKYDGKVPNTHKELETIPGVGHKTANVVLGELYKIPTFAVDTHVDRVSKRLGLTKEKDDVKIIERKLKRVFQKERWTRTHHQMVLFGRYYCKSQKPDCEKCKLKGMCKNKYL